MYGQSKKGEKKGLNSELGPGCASPLLCFPKTGNRVVFDESPSAAEEVVPPLDYFQQPPAQELVAMDFEGKFSHVFREQPKRHFRTTGWSVFISAKRLVAGESVLFIWNEKNQVLLGIHWATRPQTVLPSSTLSSDSMHSGLLAAAALA